MTNTPTQACEGLETEPGVTSGCNADQTGASDCPTCGPEHTLQANDEAILDVVRRGLPTVVQEIALAKTHRKEAEKAFDRDDTLRVARLSKLKQQLELLSSGVNPEIMALGQKVVRIVGKPEESAEGAMEDAIEAIAAGGRKLVDQYIGSKRYGRFHQRCDCEYGYGPKHGSIVFAVELQDEARSAMRMDTTATLGQTEREAAIVYLMAMKRQGEQRKLEASRRW